MRKKILFVFIINLSFNLFSSSKSLEKSEIYNELFRLSLKVQKSEIEDFIKYNELDKVDIESLNVELLYLDLINPQNTDLTSNIKKLNYENYDVKNRNNILKINQVLNKEKFSGNSQFSNKLKNYYEYISDRSPKRDFNFYAPAEKILSIDSIIKIILSYIHHSDYENLDKLLVWLEDKELSTDSIPITIENSVIDFKVYDPFLYKLISSSYLLISKKEIDKNRNDSFKVIKTLYKMNDYTGMVKSYNKFGNDNEDYRIEAYKILADIELNKSDISTVFQKEKNENKFISYLLTEYLIHNQVPNDSVKKIFETYFLDSPVSTVNNQFNYLNNLTSSIYFLRDDIYYKSYHAFASMKDFFLKDKNQLRKAKWIILYIHCRFENGRDDRNAGKEINKLFNTINDSDIYMELLQKIFAQYYVHHINAKF